VAYKPEEWLFEGLTGGQYPAGSIQFIINIPLKNRNKKESKCAYFTS
jgi:hypothetical protein